MKKILLSALALVFIAACQPGAVSDVTPNFQGDVQWSCVQYQCAEYGSGLEWADANCEQTENGTYCPIVQNGQQYAVPLDQINLTAITQQQTYCKQYRCVQEAPSRTTNYTVEPSELTGQQPSQNPGQTTQ
jgi:hypothetical protein